MRLNPRIIVRHYVKKRIEKIRDHQYQLYDSQGNLKDEIIHFEGISPN